MKSNSSALLQPLLNCGLQPLFQFSGSVISYPGGHEHLKLGKNSHIPFCPHSPCTSHNFAIACHDTIQLPFDTFRLYILRFPSDPIVSLRLTPLPQSEALTFSPSLERKNPSVSRTAILELL
uniref:Uncharacterized protein n=1 Tax=Triticum urartu TaxID=4572 RepID=A0A8R7VGG2_TRIUA